MRVIFLIFGYLIPILTFIQIFYYAFQMRGRFSLERILPILFSYLMTILIAAAISMLCFYAAREIKKVEDAAWEELE